jgi:DegV family protein with EDD domain
MSFWIVTDVGSDMSLDFYKRYDKLRVLPMIYRMDGQEKKYYVEDEPILKDFYRKLRDGRQASTAAVPVDSAAGAFEEIVKQGGQVLYITLSSGISASIQSGELAAEMVLEKHPDAKISVVDSLLASGGQLLMVYYALKLREEGKTLEEVVTWLTDNRQRFNSWFTVDDLNHLFRGGRVSRSSALIGSMLRIKPVLRVNEEGKLVPFEKVQGRKRSLKALADKAIALSNPKEGQKYFISHGDCQEDAQYVADLIKEGLPNTGEFMLSPCGAVIGAHSGPGTVALFFMGDHR